MNLNSLVASQKERIIQDQAEIKRLRTALEMTVPFLNTVIRDIKFSVSCRDTTMEIVDAVRQALKQ